MAESKKNAKKSGMVNSQMGVEESLANPANLVRLRITLRIVLSSLPKNKKLLIGAGGRRVGPQIFFNTLDLLRHFLFQVFLKRSGKSS